MIDSNDIRKQLNLAESAVLKMVEEEEYEKAHPAAANERKSRPRNRCISREDVLKINRRHPRRNISWPPPDDRSRSRSSGDELHFGERVRNENSHLKETSDRGPINSKNKRNNFRSSPGEKITACESQVANPSYEKSAQFNDCESAKCQQDWPPKSYNDDDNDKMLAKKTFHLPENELHIGKIEPIRKFFQDASSRSWKDAASQKSPSPSPNRGRIYRDDATMTRPKRWRSHENITLTNNKPSSAVYSPSAAQNSHKKDNLPLERYKSNSYNELPPLKPRREHHKNVQATKKELNLNNSGRMGASKSDENLNIDSSKNNISRDTAPKTIRFQVEVSDIDRMGLSVATEPPPEVVSCGFGSTKNIHELGQRKADRDDQNRRPFPPDDLMHNRNNNYNRVGQSSSYDLASTIANYETENSCTRGNFTPELNAVVNNQRIVRPGLDDGVQQNGTAIKINDFAKQSTGIPEAPTRQKPYMPQKSPRKHRQFSKDTNLVVPNDMRDENLLHETTLSSGQHCETNNEEKYEETTKNITAKDHDGVSITSKNNKNERRRGMCFTDGEYIWGPYETTPPPQPPPPFENQGDILAIKLSKQETSGGGSLSIQRELVQEAITQDILRINEYMKRAEQEVLDAERNAKESLGMTPLQTILKQIVLEKGLTRTDPITMLSDQLACFDPMAIEIENMPVVDRALIDLLKISRVLETLNNNPSQPTADDDVRDGADVDNNTHARITEIDDSREATSSVDTTISPSYCTSTTPGPESTSTSRTASGATIVDKIIQSKNILSGYLIAKQSQEELFENNVHLSGSDNRPGSSASSTHAFFSDFANGKTFAAADDDDEVAPDNRDMLSRINKYNDRSDSDKLLACKDNEARFAGGEKIIMSSPTRLTDPCPIIISRKDDKLIRKPIKSDQQEACHARVVAARGTHDNSDVVVAAVVTMAIHPGNTATQPSHHHPFHLRQPSPDEPANCSTLPANICPTQAGQSDESLTNYRRQQPNFQAEPKDAVQQQDTDELKNNGTVLHRIASSLSNYLAGESNYGGRVTDDNESLSGEVQGDYSLANPLDNRGRSRLRNNNLDTRVRSSSQPCSLANSHVARYHLPSRQHSVDSSESRYYGSPSLYLLGHFSPTQGYKRVAWPPADAISVPSVPQLQPQPTYQNQYQPQTTQAFQPVSPKVQESYQQPIYQQPQLQSQEQPQYHSQAQAQHYPYGRGQSAGVIHLRQQAPISQRPAPVFTSQPAAASFRDLSPSGGSNMRGDMKWPPAEYKAQAAAENEERRKLALGPIFRPRRVNKDYSQFFAKNALNQYYPGYKVPPGTQHVYAEY